VYDLARGAGAVNNTAYRYPSEHAILALTLVIVVSVIALTATATVCLSVVFVAVMVGVGYAMTRAQHRELLGQALPVSPEHAPALTRLVRGCAARLQVRQVQVFVANSPVLNAYTFGILPPYVVVLNSALLQTMDADELRFIIGHELGHVRLGHTWLNSLVGGMAGIPSPFLASAVLSFAFLWWNRACEHSADRAGLLACGKPSKAISALVKLASGPETDTPGELLQALRQIEAEDDTALASLGEALSTHPMMGRRIEQLRRYAQSAEYRRLQPLLAHNEDLAVL